MTLARTIAGMLPAPARSFAFFVRESWRLRQVPAEACDARSLRYVDDATLRLILAAAAMHTEWRTIAEELGAFDVTSTAGGVNPGDRRALYYLIRALKPARVLEVGTHIGASTIHVAAALRQSEREGGPSPSLTTVDIEDVNAAAIMPWKRYGSSLAPAEMVRRLGMVEHVRFVTQSSLTFLTGAQEPFDMIFLDGDHSAAIVYRELPAALNRLAPGGLVVLHDYYPDGRPLYPGDPIIPGPWLAVDRLRKEGAGLAVLPLGDLPWPTKLGGNVTSLALVTSNRRSG